MSLKEFTKKILNGWELKCVFKTKYGTVSMIIDPNKEGPDDVLKYMKEEFSGGEAVELLEVVPILIHKA